VSGVSRLIAAAELSLGRPDDDPIGQLEPMTNLPDGVFRVETDSLEPGFIVRAHFLGSFSYAPSDSDPFRLDPVYAFTFRSHNDGVRACVSCGTSPVCP
jgi:hypothetical protein